MAVGTSARESLKEMKRLKNEPLLLLAIIAIILFVGLFVVYPVIKVILFPDGATYMELFSRPRWFTAIKNSLFMTLVSTISCTAGCALQGAVPLHHLAAHRLAALYRGAELHPALRRPGHHHQGPAGPACGYLRPARTLDCADRHVFPVCLLGDLWRHAGDLHESGVRGL